MKKSLPTSCAWPEMWRWVSACVLALGLLTGCNDDDNDSAPLSYAKTIADGRVAVRQALSQTNTPSASVALIDGDRIAWSETFGTLDPETQTAPSATTMYGIGSVSKVFAAVAIMKLVDQGKIDLDTPLIQYLPDFRMAVPEYSQITVRMLLNHSAGFGGSDYRNTFTNVAVLDYASQVQQALASQRLKHLPGEMAVYCNDCLTMLEPLVAAVSGRSYTQFVADEILAPLGMTHSRYALEPFPAGSFAPARTENRVDPQEYTNGYATGGLYSTPNDMARLAMMFINGGKLGNVRVLSEASVAEMGRDQTRNLTFNPIRWPWGLGWDGVAQPGLAAVGVTAWHKNGGTLSYGSEFFVAPTERMAVMVTGASVALNAGELAERIMLHALAERGRIPAVPTPLPNTPQPEQPATDTDLAAIVGDYAQYEALLRIEAQSDRTLKISTYRNGAWTQTSSGLKRRVDGSFSSDAEPYMAYWTFEGEGRRYLAARRLGGMKHYLMEIPYGQQVEPAAPPSAAWQERVGQRWLVVNEDARSIPLVQGTPPRLALDTVDGLPGYLFASSIQTSSQIVDPAGSDTLARMFLKIPVNLGRDLSDVVIETRDGEEWVRQGSSLFRPQAGVSVLPVGDSAVTIGGEGFAEWRKLPIAGTVTITGASAWKLYDADLKLLASGLGNGSTGTALVGTYLMMYGAPDTAIMLTLAAGS